jgi:hypothetical protein
MTTGSGSPEECIIVDASNGHVLRQQRPQIFQSWRAALSEVDLANGFGMHFHATTDRIDPINPPFGRSGIPA